MRYDNFPGEKTYVVFHTEGTGEQGGAPIEEKEYLDSFDTEEEALAFGRTRYPRITGWEWDNFRININRLTDKGKELYAEFERAFATLEQRVKDHPDEYTTYQFGDTTITMQHNELFDGPKK